MNLKKKAYCFLFPEFDISFQDGAVKVCVHLGLLEATLLYTLKGTSAAVNVSHKWEILICRSFVVAT